MEPCAPVFADSFAVFLTVLRENRLKINDVRLVIADPSQVPERQIPWKATFAEWQWLHIDGAPASPPYDAAEVVLGDGWCIANSEWGADDWVFAKGGERLLARAQTSGQSLVRLLIPRDAPTPLISVESDLPVRLGRQTDAPGKHDTKPDSSTETAAKASVPTPPSKADLSAEMLQKLRSNIRVRLRRSRIGEILEYPAEDHIECGECDESQALFRCGKCNGSGEIAGNHCRACGGDGDTLRCLNPYCDASLEDESEEAAEEAAAEAASKELLESVELLKAAIGFGRTVRFQYRDAKGKETDREAEPREWHFVKHDHDWAGGGNVCVVAFCHLRHEDRVFAVHRMRNLKIVSGAPDQDPRLSTSQGVDGFGVGSEVEHFAFGRGQIQSFSGSGTGLRVSVEFVEHGAKLLIWKFAKLQKPDASAGM